jgi:DNA invertase Pin-like site-specific DNA recombinase
MARIGIRLVRVGASGGMLCGMSGLQIGYARVSTADLDLTSQRDAMLRLGVLDSNIYVDHGLTGQEGMAVARAKGHLKGKQPKLSITRRKLLFDVQDRGEYAQTEIAELFNVSRATVYRELQRCP